MTRLHIFPERPYAQIEGLMTWEYRIKLRRRIAQYRKNRFPFWNGKEFLAAKGRYEGVAA